MTHIGSLLAIVAIYTLLALSFLIVLRVGEVSFGQQAYFAIGAYASAVGTAVFGWSLVASAIFALVLAAVAAAAIGIVALRMQGFQFSLYTLVVAEFIREALGRWNWQTSVSGRLVGPEGTMGFTSIDYFARAGISPEQQAVIIFLLAAATVAVTHFVLQSKYGRLMVAASEDRKLAESLGIETNKVRTTAYLVAAVIAGSGGVLFAHYVTYIDPQNFGLMTGVHALAYTLIGGIGHVAGALAGTAFDVVFLDGLRVFGSYRMVVFGVLIIAMLALLPRGIFAHRKPTRVKL